MYLKNKIAIGLASMLLAACSSTTPSYHLETSYPTTNNNLSSGSGATVSGNDIVVVGDDEPWLFHVNEGNGYSTASKEKIKDYPLNQSGRINKSIKPDFESLSKVRYQGKDYYLILGSGSKSTRNLAYLVNIQDQTKLEFDLSGFYKKLYALSGFNVSEHINIEATAIAKDKIFIFNRGNSGTNIIFEMNWNQFMNFITKTSESLNTLKPYFVALPKIDGVESTFSGADYWPQTDSLVFSASVESESTAINDGKVLGSFIGVLPIDQLKQTTSLDNSQSLTPYMQLLKKQNKTIITKVEAVAIQKSDDQTASGYFVSDNDDGTSQFIHFNLAN